MTPANQAHVKIYVSRIEQTELKIFQIEAPFRVYAWGEGY